MTEGWGSESVSQRVVLAVAEETGRNPTDLEPLHRSIDSDGLNDLFDSYSEASRSVNGEVSFRYADHEVSVSDDGQVEVTAIGTAVADNSPDGRSISSPGEERP